VVKDIRRALFWCALVVLGYFACVDQVTGEEAVAAFGCGIAIAAFLIRMEKICGELPLPPLAGIVAVVSRTPWAVLTEAWFLLGIVLWQRLALGRTIEGRWIELRYEPLPSHDDTGRRAVVILGASISPNAIPLRLDESRGRLVLHQLYARREPGAGDARYPF
jgi:hypothetical protein